MITLDLEDTINKSYQNVVEEYIDKLKTNIPHLNQNGFEKFIFSIASGYVRSDVADTALKISEVTSNFDIFSVYMNQINEIKNQENTIINLNNNINRIIEKDKDLLEFYLGFIYTTNNSSKEDITKGFGVIINNFPELVPDYCKMISNFKDDHCTSTICNVLTQLGNNKENVKTYFRLMNELNDEHDKSTFAKTIEDSITKTPRRTGYFIEKMKGLDQNSLKNVLVVDRLCHSIIPGIMLAEVYGMKLDYTFNEVKNLVKDPEVWKPKDLSMVNLVEQIAKEKGVYKEVKFELKEVVR